MQTTPRRSARQRLRHGSGVNKRIARIALADHLLVAERYTAVSANLRGAWEMGIPRQDHEVEERLDGRMPDVFRRCFARRPIWLGGLFKADQISSLREL